MKFEWQPYAQRLRFIPTMDLRQVRYFIAVAEEASFSAAAARLNMSQPPLSQQIKALEDELGIQLLQRHSRGVTLTDAGRVFLVRSHQIAEHVSAATREAVQSAAGCIGTLRIGTIGSALYSILPVLLDRLKSALPEVEFTVREMSSSSQMTAVCADDLDLGVIHGPAHMRGLFVETIFTEPLCAAVPLSHPLARRAATELSALRNESFVLFARELAPGFFDRIIATCHRANFSPRIVHTARNLPAMIRMTAMNLGVSVLPESLAGAFGSEVSFLPLADPDATLELSIIRRADPVSALIASAWRHAGCIGRGAPSVG
jgi:DNA-binding transcriptional LysR family regulator